jgi:hypothetical protein
MIRVPATLSFGIQVSPAILCLTAVFPLIMDGFVQSGFRLFDGMLTFTAIIGVQAGCRHKEKESRCKHGTHHGPSESSLQDFLLSGLRCGQKIPRSLGNSMPVLQYRESCISGADPHQGQHKRPRQNILAARGSRLPKPGRLS